MKTMFTVVLATVFLAFVSATPECPSNQDDVVLVPNPNDCASYYACDGGVAYLMNCSAGLLFNPELRVCDWADNVTCSINPSSSPAPSEEPNEVPVKETREESSEEPNEVPVKETREESSEELIEEPSKEPSKEPRKEPSKEPRKEPSKEPSKERSKEPSKESSEESDEDVIKISKTPNAKPCEASSESSESNEESDELPIYK